MSPAQASATGRAHDREHPRWRSDQYPSVELPAITADQMREVDRVMVQELGIELVQMMENAGRSLADLAVARYAPASCTVLAGSGNNGGGGMVAARHLHNRGVDVTVVLIEPAPGGVPGHQLAILRRMGIPIVSEPRHATLVIDALIGYGLHGDPSGAVAAQIRWANAWPAPVLALDVPSGLDATTGRIGEPCIAADTTLTLALPKTGLARAAQVVGDLYVADISVPASVYNAVGMTLDTPFAAGPILRLWGSG